MIKTKNLKMLVVAVFLFILPVKVWALEEVIINSTNDLTKYGMASVTKEKVLESIDNNSNLNDKYRRLAKTLLNTLLAKYPNLDLRIFNDNISDLKIEEYTEEEVKDIFPSGAGAAYNSGTNTVIITDNAPLEDVYHELFHAFHIANFTSGNYAVYRNEANYIAFNETMTSMASNLLAKSPRSYEFPMLATEYLATLANYTVEDFNNEGVIDLINRLKGLYLDVDFDLINRELNAYVNNTINNGYKDVIDIYPDLIDELFKICLKEIDSNDPYFAFNNFAKMFAYLQDATLVFNYLEQYNTKLQSLGVTNIILKSEAIDRLNYYKEVNGIIYRDDVVYPIIYKSASDVKILNRDGTKTPVDSGVFYVDTVFLSRISSTLIKNYDNFGTNNYFKSLDQEYYLINPGAIKKIPVMQNNKIIITDYLSDLYVVVGSLDNGKVGFALKDKNNRVLAKTPGKISNVSNEVSLFDYVASLSNFIEYLNLEDIFNEDYLYTYISYNSNLFNNIKITNKSLSFIDGVSNEVIEDGNDSPTDPSNPDTPSNPDDNKNDNPNDPDGDSTNTDNTNNSQNGNRDPNDVDNPHTGIDSFISIVILGIVVILVIRNKKKKLYRI